MDAHSWVQSTPAMSVLKSQLITNEFNKDKLNDREKLSSRKILNKLKTMGLESTMGSGGGMAVIWDDKKIGGLQAEFGIEEGDFENNPPNLSNLTTSLSSQTPTDGSEPYYADLADKEGL